MVIIPCEEIFILLYFCSFYFIVIPFVNYLLPFITIWWLPAPLRIASCLLMSAHAACLCKGGKETEVTTFCLPRHLTSILISMDLPRYLNNQYSIYSIINTQESRIVNLTINWLSFDYQLTIVLSNLAVLSIHLFNLSYLFYQFLQNNPIPSFKLSDNYYL